MLKNIKSRYIIKEILNLLDEGRKLKLIKYNKKFQDKIDVTKNDFRKYCQIEIELSLIEIEETKKMKFINRKEEYLNLYHIYFENETKEKKRDYVTNKESIEKIKIIIEFEIKSLKELFSFCEDIKSIKFTKFNRGDITNMNSLFSNCTSLAEIDFEQFKTNNVTDMSYMFYNCSNLTSIDLSKFKTTNVTNMNNMFSWCNNLIELDLKNFNTENVINMGEMFSCCNSLQNIDISNFNFNKVNNMYFMFSGCESLNISNNFNNIVINNNANIEGMFLECSEELKEKIKKENKIINEEAFSGKKFC